MTTLKYNHLDKSFKFGKRLNLTLPIKLDYSQVVDSLTSRDSNSFSLDRGTIMHLKTDH